MRWSNLEEERGRQKKKNHLAENSDERAGEMGLIWGEALAIAQVTAQDRVEWRRFDCGLMFQPG